MKTYKPTDKKNKNPYSSRPQVEVKEENSKIQSSDARKNIL